MSNAFYKIPEPVNEPVRQYAPHTPERENLKKALEAARSKVIEIPQYIGREEVYSGQKQAVVVPHDHQHVLAYFHQGTEEHVAKAINAALKVREDWAQTPWEDRAAIFLKAAALIAGPYRDEINAATMLGQSKNVFQAEIDAACELIDFLRFNVHFM